MIRNVYTVGQINGYISNLFSQDFMLKRIAVKGEVSNCKYHSSGHIYFSLKDSSGVISAVLFANARKKGLSFPMKDGDKVIVEGSIRVYERSGVYQLYAQNITLEGAGLLYQRFEALKKELAEMGMFAPEYKQPIPRFVSCVGIVTAPTGAAVRDIQNIAGRRNPYVQLILYPAQVQGEGAAQSVCNGIRALEDLGVDVIIVGRGGGSIEDLWAFNERIVAETIFDCRVPVISAVGHETDTTIADYVADLRAPTPSAAAELAVFDIRKVMQDLQDYQVSMRQQMEQKICSKREALRQLRLRLAVSSPRQRLLSDRQQTADYLDRLQSILQGKVNERRHELKLYTARFPFYMNEQLQKASHRLEICQSRLPDLMEQKVLQTSHQLALYASRLDALSPLKRLGSGYSYLADQEEHPITRIGQLQKDMEIKGRLRDGRFTARVTAVQKDTIV